MFTVNPSDLTFTYPIIVKFFNTYKNHPTVLTNLHNLLESLFTRPTYKQPNTDNEQSLETAEED